MEPNRTKSDSRANHCVGHALQRSAISEPTMRSRMLSSDRARQRDCVELAGDVDGQIRQSCQRENYAAATHLLLRGYGARVRSYLRVRTRDSGATDEAFSLFSEDVWRGLPGFRFDCNVYAWVFALARHALCRYMRSRERWSSRHVSLSVAETQLEGGHPADVEYELGARWAALLHSLPRSDSSLLVQRLSLCMGWRDVALAHLVGRERSDESSIARESARLRKRYQLLVKRLSARESAERAAPPMSTNG